jgi:hypothetical protein
MNSPSTLPPPSTGWSDMERLQTALRTGGHADAAQELDRAERGGSTSTEILGNIGQVLHRHHALRATLDAPARAAWDALLHAVYRAYPGLRLRHGLARLLGR